MRRVLLSVAAFIAVLVSFQAAAGRSHDLGYDPKANPFEQYHEAIARAQADNKLVLVIAGGDWCRWCHVLGRFVSGDAEVERGLHDAFVVMKVYVGDQNYNEDFFSQLPQARGAPYFWIISPEKRVLASQSTREFESGRNDYDKGEFLAFVDRWKRQIVDPARGPMVDLSSD